MEYKQFAIDLARRAGSIITTNFTLGMKKEWKADNTPLTMVDLTINQMVLDAVHAQFHGHGILAEEGNDFTPDQEYVWVCDPLDGTIPFSHGIPTCVFSLALTRHGDPILGVVYDPFMDRLYDAEKGKGATLNGSPIHVSTAATLQNTLIGMAYWTNGLFFRYTTVHDALVDQNVKMMNVMSITYMAALVSNGEFAATIFQGQSPFDTAAVKVIVEEAGGRVTDLFGNRQRYDRDIKGHIVSNGSLHPQLLAIINSAKI